MFGATTSTAMTALLTHMLNCFAVRSENTLNSLSLYGESDTALKRIIKFIKKKKACSKRENLNDAALASKENESGISGKDIFIKV